MASLTSLLLTRGDAEDHDAPEGGEGARATASKLGRRSSPRRRRPGAVVGLEDGRPEVLRARVDGRVGAEPGGQRRASPRSRRGRSPGRRRACELDGERPVPPAAASTTTVSPGSRRAQRWTSACAVRPWSSSAAAWSSETSSGIGTSQSLGDRHLLRVAAGGEHRRHPAPVRGAAGDLTAWRHRQGLLGDVVVAGRVGVGEVDPGARDLDDDLARRRARGRAARRAPSPRARRTPRSGLPSRSERRGSAPAAVGFLGRILFLHRRPGDFPSLAHSCP